MQSCPQDNIGLVKRILKPYFGSLISTSRSFCNVKFAFERQFLQVSSIDCAELYDFIHMPKELSTRQNYEHTSWCSEIP